MGFIKFSGFIVYLSKSNWNLLLVGIVGSFLFGVFFLVGWLVGFGAFELII